MRSALFLSAGHVMFVLSSMPFVLTQDPVVTIPQGRVVGIKAYTENSISPVEIYFGVPYATAPTGRYRFSAPERHAGWKKTFYAHRLPPQCPNLSSDVNGHFSEDCLFLNIWTPRRSDGKTLPVVVIFYSESWTKGGISLPCQQFAAEGVVVVSVMYRLHILAFFTLASISARGNLALLDQYLALLWVRDNIAAFGGDPTMITVLGHSAGADSVLHHMTSTRSIGLFQRAIIMSPINIWKALDGQNVVQVSEVEKASREIARSLGCRGDVDQEILACMRDRPLAAIMSLYSNDSWSKLMQPVSDEFLPESEQYLPVSLFAALSASTLSKKQLDIILGSNDLEALNYSPDEYGGLVKLGKQYLSDHTNKNVLPEALKLFSLDHTELLPLLTQAVRWEYFNKKSVRDISNVYDEIEYMGRIETSSQWSTGIALIAARLAQVIDRLYVYRYSQPAGIELHGKTYNFTGAVHGTDLVALLGDAMMLQVARRPASINEKQASAIFRRNIINFIKFGFPDNNGLWKMYKSGDANIYEFCDKISLDAKCMSKSRDVEFWLQYLPQLFKSMNPNGKTDNLVSEPGESRLRGGLIAMCGTAIILLLLLCICILLFHRYNSHRFNVTDENHY